MNTLKKLLFAAIAAVSFGNSTTYAADAEPQGDVVMAPVNEAQQDGPRTARRKKRTAKASKKRRRDSDNDRNGDKEAVAQAEATQQAHNKCKRKGPVRKKQNRTKEAHAEEGVKVEEVVDSGKGSGQGSGAGRSTVTQGTMRKALQRQGTQPTTAAGFRAKVAATTATVWALWQNYGKTAEQVRNEALIRAVQNKNHAKVKELLAQDANPTFELVYGETALHIAKQTDKTIYTLLMQVVNKRLEVAVKTNNADAAQTALRLGADPCAMCVQGAKCRILDAATKDTTGYRLEQLMRNHLRKQYQQEEAKLKNQQDKLHRAAIEKARGNITHNYETQHKAYVTEKDSEREKAIALFIAEQERALTIEKARRTREYNEAVEAERARLEALREAAIAEKLTSVAAEHNTQLQQKILEAQAQFPDLYPPAPVLNDDDFNDI